jgi:pimeloyl-ACP methyl ester carboxylesterase
MKRTHGIFAACGVLLLAVGAALTWWASRGYTEKQYLVDAGSCRLELTMLEKSSMTPESDAVVLFHGLAANRKIMENLARVFAEMGVRVFIPDLPGHGGSKGPFTPQRAEECSLSLLRGLAARGMIDPEHTILLGHSMGGAIALRIAPKFRPAGVIAISPAPMVAAHGVAPENLLYRDPPPLGPNTLILASQIEPKGLRANAEDLAATRQDGSVRFKLIPWNTHVGVLFSRTVASDCQDWAKRVFHRTETRGHLPSEANIAGGVLGIAGVLLLAVPFLWEMFGEEKIKRKEVDAAPRKREERPTGLPTTLRAALEYAAVSIAMMLLLKYWVPLRFIRLFEGDYLASFFLIVGVVLIWFHWNLVKTGARAKVGVLFSAVVAGIILHLLVTGWFALTVTGSWLTAERWLRFPLFFLAALVFLYALELGLGPAEEHHPARRVLLSLFYLGIAWAVLAAGVFYLHSGQIMLVLLAPFFVLFSIFLRMGMQLVRRLSASPAAAAVFGAILLAGLCLVLFPVS